MSQEKVSNSVLSLMALAAIIISIIALNKRTGGQAEDTLAKIQQTKQIEACTVIDPPGVIKDAKTGELSGHQIDAMKLIAERIGATVTWRETTFGNAAADLQAKRCDIVATDLFANIPRAAAVAFSKPPMFYVGESALVRKDSPYAGIKDIFDLDKPDVTVAVATGESGDIFVKEHFKQAKVNRIDVEAADLTRFAVEVSAGRADAAIADSNTIRLFAEQHPEVTNLFAGHPFALNPVGWAVRQDDTKWLHFIETSLQFLETQGTLVELEHKYNAHWLHELKQYGVQ